MVLDCTTAPNNIINMDEYSQYISTNSLTQEQLNDMLVCINKNITNDENNPNVIDNNITLIDKYNLINNDNETSNEINRYSLYLYNNDVIYTYSKIIILFILAGVYFYFFKITGINLTTIIDTAKKTIDELPNIKKKIENKIIKPDNIKQDKIEKTTINKEIKVNNK
jgi:hypothetical protein